VHVHVFPSTNLSVTAHPSRLVILDDTLEEVYIFIYPVQKAVSSFSKKLKGENVAEKKNAYHHVIFKEGIKCQ